MKQTIEERLRDLYVQHRADLPALAWISEADRWAEFVFCVLASSKEMEAAETREVLTLLYAAGAISVAALAAPGEPRNEAQTVVAFVLKSHGWPEDSARRHAVLLRHLATAVQQAFAGKIQRYFRRHGELMRDELVELFGHSSIHESQLRYAVSLWLQNAFALPISLEHEGVAAFCHTCGASAEQVEASVDDLDLNLAVLDDLLDREADLPDTPDALA